MKPGVEQTELSPVQGGREDVASETSDMEFSTTFLEALGNFSVAVDEREAEILKSSLENPEQYARGFFWSASKQLWLLI